MKRMLPLLMLCLLLLAGCGPSQVTFAPDLVEVGSAPDAARPEPSAPLPVLDTEPTDPPAGEADGVKPAPSARPPVAPPPAPPAQPRVAVLMYHDVSATQEDAYTISAELLEAQILMFKEEGYHFYSLRDMERLLAGEPMPEKGVMLTFDDGYASFYTTVLPIAQRHEVPVICFVITQYLDRVVIGGRPHMNQAETMAAASSSFGELGGHSHNAHYVALTGDGTFQPALTHRIIQLGKHVPETDEEYAERILEDYQLAAQMLAQHGESTGTRHYAFPFTARTDEAVSLGQEAGFRYFYVGGEQLASASSDPTAIPRVHAGAPYITADWLRERLRHLFSQP